MWEQERLTVVLALNPTSILSAKGEIREEIINTVVRQTKKLIATDYDVLIFLSGPDQYCRQLGYGEKLRLAFGKVNIFKVLTEAFARKDITTCELDCDMEIAKATMQEAFACDVVPLVASNVSCRENSAQLASFCNRIGVDMVVIAVSKAEILAKQGEISSLFSLSAKSRLALHYEPNFFLKAVELEGERTRWMLE